MSQTTFRTSIAWAEIGSLRSSAVTSCPVSARCVTTWRPMKPEAPVTNTVGLLDGIRQEKSQVVVGHSLQGEMAADVFASRRAHGVALCCVMGKIDHGPRKGGHVSGWNEAAIHSVNDLLGSTTDIAGDHG